jgi:hypothetical protein
MRLGRAVLQLCGMSNYRRAWVQGGTYFFTVNLLERRRRLLVERRPAAGCCPYDAGQGVG